MPNSMHDPVRILVLWIRLSDVLADLLAKTEILHTVDEARCLFIRQL